MPRLAWNWKNTIFDLNKISIKNYQRLWEFYNGNFKSFIFSDWLKYNANFILDVIDKKPYIEFSYFLKWKYIKYKVLLDKVKCNFWWYRYYFICPKLDIKTTSLYFWTDWCLSSRKALNLCYRTQLYWKRQRVFNKLFNSNEAEKIEETIKYKYRNWKPTRKYLKAMKLRNIRPSREEFKYFVEK